jgi:drug/metabolite transporter (DMT)-like permease
MNRMTAGTQKTASAGAIWAGMISIYLVWGSTYLAIMFAVDTIPPFIMAGARHLSAGLILYLWRRLAGDPRPSRVHWRSAAVVGILLLTGGNGLVSWAEQVVPSSIAALLVGSVPLWIMFFEILRGFLSHKATHPSWIAIVGILIGFGGIVLLVGPWQVKGDLVSVDIIGAGALLLASLLWAAGSLYSRTAKLPDSPLMGTALESLVGGAACMLVASLAGEWGSLELSAVSGRSLLGLLYLIVFGSLVGFASYTWLLRSAPVTLVSTYAYVNPVVAIFLGALLAGEPLTSRVVIAAMVILGSVALITRTPSVRRRVKPMHPQPAPAETDDYPE